MARVLRPEQMNQTAGPGASSLASLVPAGLASLVIKAGALGLQVAISILLARRLGPEGLGVYALVMAVVHLVAITLQCGLGDYLVRSIAVARARDRSGLIRAEVATTAWIVGFLALVLVTGAVALDRFTSGWVSGLPLLEALLIASFIALTAILSGAMRGLGHVLWGQVPHQWVRPALMLAILMLLVPGNALAPHDALLAYAVASLGGLIVASAMLLLVLPVAEKRSTTQVEPRVMLMASLPFLALAAVHVLHQQTDVLMVGLLASQAEVGLYRAALNVGDALQAGLLALSVVIAPRIASLHGRGDWSSLSRLVASAHGLALIVMTPIAVTAALFAGPLIITLFGSVFEPAQTATVIVALGKIAYAAVGFAGLVLAMSGRPGLAATITVAALILNVVLNALLIPHFGIAGAAIATAVSQFGINAIALWWLMRGLDAQRAAKVVP